MDISDVKKKFKSAPKTEVLNFIIAKCIILGKLKSAYTISICKLTSARAFEDMDRELNKVESLIETAKQILITKWS